MICSYCNTDNREDAKFCNECGRILSSSTNESSTSSQEAHKEDLIEDANELNEAIANNENVSPAELIELAALELKALNESSDSVTPLASNKETSSKDDEKAEATTPDADAKPFIYASDKTAPLDPTPPAAYAPVQPTPFAPTTDLSGIDECLVDSSYIPPQNAWRGSTMEMNAIKDEGSDRPREAKEHRSETKPNKQYLNKKPHYAAIIVGGLVVAVGLFIFSTYALELWGGKIIPDVTGKTTVDAEYLLEDKGFNVEVNEVHSDETQGIVLYVTPNVGDRTDSETPVVINVSIPRVIPEVSGAQYDDIIAALHEQGISNITTKEERSSEEAGLVLNITPQPGSIVKSTDKVVITAAVPFEVPNVLGLTLEEAQDQLKAAGYNTTIIYDTKESDRNNIVLFTEPSPDSLLNPGETVTLTISQSRGATLVDETNAFLQDLQKSHEPLFDSNGNGYYIRTIDSVKSLGNETTSFVATATTTTDTQTEIQIKGSIVWDSLNYIVSIDVNS